MTELCRVWADLAADPENADAVAAARARLVDLVWHVPGCDTCAVISEAMPFPKRVFAVLGMRPEPGGYAVAKFSRSARPYEEWAAELTEAGAERFYEQFLTRLIALEDNNNALAHRRTFLSANHARF